MSRTNKLLTRAAAVGYMALLAPLAFAQTTTSSTTPGAPNTGVGGDPTGTLAVLGVSAVAVIAAAVYLTRQTVLARR